MGRRRRQSTFEDIVEIASKFPWKVGLVLAVVSYLVLHTVAGIQVDRPANLNTMGNFMIKQFMVTVVAGFGQMILPFCFLVGAGWSFFKQRKNERLYDSIASYSPAGAKDTAMQAVERLTWQEFELLVGESFRRKGYVVKETGGGGADGGIDLEMSLNGQKYLVQCKQWKAFKVGVKVVREFFGVMVANGATGGFVVTSGVFTEEAAAFAEDKDITLIDGGKLVKIINSAQAAQHLEKKNIPQPTLEDIPWLNKETNASPSCPKCNSAMVRRTAKQGANAGKEFWGCSLYPKCKSVVAITT
ncbi:MAG: restriction endonuclease [Desulfurivibrionaceae bacterium]